MKTFIVAIPLFDAKMSVKAYKLCERNGDRLFGMMDNRELGDAMQAPGLELLEKLGIAPFALDKPLFVEVNPFQIMMGVPANMNLPPEKLICILSKDMDASNELLVKNCQALHDAGYQLAFDDLPQELEGNPFWEMTDYVFMDFGSIYFSELFQRFSPYFGKKTIVFVQVPDLKTYETLGMISPALYSGSFYSMPVTQGDHEISPLKVNALHLMNMVNQSDFELTDAAKTIERDLSLSISLLRFINAMSNRSSSSKKIDSIRNAVAILGQNEVKRWANVAITVQMADTFPNEITKLSLVRAKFAENLAKSYEMGMFAPSLFLAGLFSLLDVILGKPMAQAVEEVAVDERVHKALAEKQGELYEVLELIYAYERADWDGVSINMIRNQVELEDIHTAFLDALVWYKELLDVIVDQEAEEQGATTEA